MSETHEHIPFEEFSQNLDHIIERVIRARESIFVEKNAGELVEIKAVTTTEHTSISKEDDDAFLSAAGGWADVDTDAFLEMIYESRKSSRPPVEL